MGFLCLYSRIFYDKFAESLFCGIYLNPLHKLEKYQDSFSVLPLATSRLLVAGAVSSMRMDVHNCREGKRTEGRRNTLVGGIPCTYDMSLRQRTFMLINYFLKSLLDSHFSFLITVLFARQFVDILILCVWNNHASIWNKSELTQSSISVSCMWLWLWLWLVSSITTL